jgi:hypothetical protein
VLKLEPRWWSHGIKETKKRTANQTKTNRQTNKLPGIEQFVEKRNYSSVTKHVGLLVQGAAEKTDGFQNELIQRRFTLLCKCYYH